MGIAKKILFVIVFNVVVILGYSKISEKHISHHNNQSKKFKVVLMLPFCFGNSSEYSLRNSMAEYYEGVEMAITELKTMGMNMHLIVLDSKKDSLEVIRLLTSREDLKEADLFIGPVYDKELVEVEKFCSVYNIPLVSPLIYYNRKLNTSNPVINCVPSDSFKFYFYGQTIAKVFKNYQVVVVHDDSAKKTVPSAARNFKKGYELYSGKACQIISFKQSFNEVWNQKDSLLVYYTGKTSSASSIAISKRGSLGGKCKIMGTIEWIYLAERTSFDAYNGIYYIDNYCVSNHDTTYKKTRKIYRTKYGGDPEKYNYIGHDQFMFFCTSLMSLGGNFPYLIENKNFRYFHTNFNFVDFNGSFVNSGCNITYLINHKIYFKH